MNTFTEVLLWILLLLMTVGLIIASLYVQKIANQILNNSKVLIELVTDIVGPIYLWMVTGMERLDYLVYGGKEPPKFMKKLGDWRLLLFIGIALIATIVMVCEICMNTDLYTLLMTIYENTSLGGIEALFEGTHISVEMCLDILLFSMVTGWFVNYCSKLSWPVQFIYDAIFILFIALIIEKLPEFRYSFVSEEWWNMLKIELPKLSETVIGDSALLSVVGYVISIWSVFLSRLLLFIILFAGFLFVVAAIGNIASSFFSGIIAFFLLGILGSGVELIYDYIPETIGTLIGLGVLVLIEVFIFNMDGIIPQKFKVEEVSMKEILMNSIEDETSKFPMITALLGGYFGIPILAMGILIVVISIFSRPADGKELLIRIMACLICFLAFLICCLPGIICVIINSKGHLKEAIDDIFAVVFCAIYCTPLILIFYVVQAVGIWILGWIFKIN